MTMKNGDTLVAQDFINLKARVKAEMARRNGYGSMTTYSSATYDYTEVPKKSEIPKLEHFSKIRDVMANINPAKVSLSNKLRSDIVEKMVLLEANMTSFEAQPRGARSNNDCASLCSGICVGTCDTACVGCSGSCSGSCDGGCQGGCSSCSGNCASDCTGGCMSNCSLVMCQGGCLGCTSTCFSGCDNSCGSGSGY